MARSLGEGPERGSGSPSEFVFKDPTPEQVCERAEEGGPGMAS